MNVTLFVTPQAKKKNRKSTRFSIPRFLPESVELIIFALAGLLTRSVFDVFPSHNIVE